MELKYKYNDGGRSNYFKGKSGDCVVRAIALATGEDYKVIYDQLTQANKLYIENKNTKLAKRLRNTKYKKSGTPRSGNFKQVYENPDDIDNLVLEIKSPMRTKLSTWVRC